MVVCVPSPQQNKDLAGDNYFLKIIKRHTSSRETFIQKKNLLILKSQVI